MLVRDPKKRIIAHEVLRHPWIHDGAAPDKPLDSAVLSRLKQFTAMNKLKKMALRLNMSKLVLVLVELQRLDCKGLVLINETEIHDLMQSVQSADVDNSGTIDYGEFIAATLHLNKVEREDHLVAAFAYFDKDGSGYITQDELQQAYEEFGLGDVRLEEVIREADQDNIFVAFRLNVPGAWQMPQGGIEDGEEPKSATIRELGEETGIVSTEIIAEVSYEINKR